MANNLENDFQFLYQNITNMKAQMVLREPDPNASSGIKRFIKRVIRKIVGWYIRPIYQQQIEFNMSVERAFEDLYRINRDMSSLSLPDNFGEVGRYFDIKELLENDDNYAKVVNCEDRRIIQVVSSLNYGDAVGNDVIAIQNHLRQQGYVTAIFTNYLHPKIPNGVAYSIEAIPELREDDIVLYHYASEDPLVSFIKKIPCKVVLRYHNVTPPKFFKGFDDGAERNTRRGLKQVKELAQYVDYGIVVSEYNKQDLIDMGYTCKIDVAPILIQFDDYRKKPSQKVIDKYSDGRSNIVFVGRLAPNKKFEDVISSFAQYKKKYDPDARLFLVGNYKETDKYYQFLCKHIKKLGVEDVIFPGHIPFDEILAYYSIADLFLCMSEHEGFCVPLVEAMFFGVPILAYKSSAVPSTLDGSGILVDEKNFDQIADYINEILSDKTKAGQIVEREKIRLKDFDNDKIGNEICRLLDEFK